MDIPESVLADGQPESMDFREQAQLTRLALEGDPAAWERLLAAHREPVFRLAYLLVGDADEAEDIAQETFIRAFRALERFNAARPMRPWLLKIAANLAHNRGRSLGRQLAALRQVFHLQAPAAEASVEALGERRIQNQRLRQAVDRLAPADREIIYLRYFLDLPVEETAQTLKIAPGTVKSRLHRALERLRSVIQSEAPELGDDRHG